MSTHGIREVRHRHAAHVDDIPAEEPAVPDDAAAAHGPVPRVAHDVNRVVVID